MSSSAANNTNTWYTSNPVYEIGPTLNFWLFLVSDIFAIICTAFVLWHLLSKKQLRTALHNHIPIILLILAAIYELIDMPLHLQFFNTGTVRPSTPLLCLVWWFIDWGFYFTIAVLLVFASIERHILIFHSQLVATKRKRLIFHYIPLVVILVSVMIFYIIAIFAPICESTFDYTSDLCGTHACYGSVPFFVAMEQIGFGAVSIGLIVIFSMALLVRVVRQKHRVHGVIQWKKQRKLAVQLISLSLLYTTFSLPCAIVYIVRLFGSAEWGSEVLPILFFLSYYAIFLLPFVCLQNLPDLWKKLRIGIPRQHRRVGIIAPQL